MFRRAIVVALALASLSGTLACAQSIEERLQEISKSAGQSTDQHRFSGGGGPIGIGHSYKEIQIQSNPTGALIVIDGRSFGLTPQAIRVDNEISAIRVILFKPGYLQTGGDLDLTSLPERGTVINEDLVPRY